jgi:lipopolysaccharide exporter
MDVRSRLLKGAIWISGARIVTNILSLVSTIVLARLLVPSDFGLVALGTTFLAIVTAVTDIPLTEALVQHRNPSDDHFHTAFTMTAARALIISLIFATMAWPAAVVYKDPRLVDVVLVLAVGMALNGFGNPRTIMLTKDLIFWQQFMLQVTQKLVALIVSVGVAIIFRSYWALLLGSIAGQIVGVGVSYTVLPFRPRLTFIHARELTSFSMWLTFSQIVNTINYRLDQLLIGTFLGKTELGFYVVGDNLAVIPTREATAPLTATVFPAFSRLADDKPRLAAAYTEAQALTTAVALPLGVGVAIIADPLVRLTMGENWLSAVFIIQALAAVFAFQTLGSLSQPLALATGQTPLLFKRDLQALLYRVPFILIGMYCYGLTGIVYARVFAGSAGLFLNTNIVTRITGLTFVEQIRTNARALVSSVFMATSATTLNQLFQPTLDATRNTEEIVVLVLFSAAVYVGSTFFLWAVSGRPTGPETELISMISKLAKFAGSTQAAREP